MRASLAALTRRQLARRGSGAVAGRWPSARPATSVPAAPSLPTPRCQSTSSSSAPPPYPPTLTPHHGWLPPRTHNAGDLRPTHIGQEVTLAGWLVQSRKPSSQMSFYPLRDSTGQVQLVMEGQDDKALMAVPRESVVHVRGVVRSRPQDGMRSDQPTGQVEVLIKEWTLLNPASTALPFHPGDEYKLPNDEFRAKHRYLDLRRPTLTENIRLRSRVAHRVRCYLHDRGFTEIETPLLLRSTPEGAREFLVPTRSPTPSFYALPQSPQQPKQLLIASGVTDKYFQIAKCFRDEDGRKDRQPEFTQIDLEMAFVDGAPRNLEEQWKIGGEQVRRTIEGLVKDIWMDVKGVDVCGTDGFKVVTYDEAMRKYGSDKPDVRFGLQVVDLAPFLRTSAGEAITAQDQEGNAVTLEVLAFRAPSGGESASTRAFSNKEMADLTQSGSGRALERFKSPTPSPHALANLLLQKSSHLRTYIAYDGVEAQDVDSELLSSGIEAALSRAQFNNTTSHGEETHLFISTRRDPPVGGSTALGDLRLRLRDAIVSKNLSTLPTEPHFLWITEFPLFTRSDEEKSHLTGGRWSSTHHPFTAPSLESLHHLQSILSSSHPSLSPQLEKLKGQHYDLVLNGSEIGGGSVRIHSALLQSQILSKILQLTPVELGRFNHLLNALDSGCPPHAGIALGFDRLMTFLTSTECKSIRDVIAFPKSAGGRDLLFAAPAGVGEEERRGLCEAWGLAGEGREKE